MQGLGGLGGLHNTHCHVFGNVCLCVFVCGFFVMMDVCVV